MLYVGDSQDPRDPNRTNYYDLTTDVTTEFRGLADTLTPYVPLMPQPKKRTPRKSKLSLPSTFTSTTVTEPGASTSSSSSSSAVTVKKTRKPYKKRTKTKPQKVITKTDDNEGNTEIWSDIICKICCALPIDSVVLFCGHRFCNKCCLAAMYADKCHICRGAVKNVCRTYDA